MSTISVIVTTHERPYFLERALLSLRKQNDSEIQIIVVSDTSCAETQRVVSAILDRSDVFLQRHSTRGPALSRAVGARLADGDYVIFLDDDDAYTETFFADVRPALAPDRIIYTNFHTVLERVDETKSVAIAAWASDLSQRDPLDLYVKNFVPLHCLVYPAALAKACTHDPQLVLNEDWDFLLEAASLAPLKHLAISGPIVYTRETADNRGRRQTEMLREVYKQIYTKRRAPTPQIEIARAAFLSQALAQVATVL